MNTLLTFSLSWRTNKFHVLLTILLIIVFYNGAVYAQQQADADLTIMDNDASIVNTSPVETLETDVSLAANTSTYFADTQLASSLFELCTSKHMQISTAQTNLLQLCNEYIENQIIRMDTKTMIQEYYLDIRLKQIERSQEIKLVVFAMVLIALTIAIIQIAFGIFGKSQARDSEIEISLNKLRLTSSISGLILLAISFLFFYLYIANVYSIT
jgi:hypothetical protein